MPELPLALQSLHDERHAVLGPQRGQPVRQVAVTVAQPPPEAQQQVRQQDLGLCERELGADAVAGAKAEGQVRLGVGAGGGNTVWEVGGGGGGG